MFLVSSLNDKLKRTMIEMDPDQNQTCQFPYEKRPTNGAVITVHKHDPNNEFDSQKLSNLTKKDWESTFTLPKLRKKWKEKINVSFDPNHKKISDDIVSEKTKEAKAFVKDLIDPDNLEIKNKRWNASVNPQVSNYPDLKKTLFEVTQGLNNFQVVPLKEKQIEEGTDSRNSLYVNGDKWNNSTLFENWEKKFLSQTTRDNAIENTIKYWKNTEYERFNESMLPISEERKKLEAPRYFHRYKTPVQDTKYRYQTMQKVKDLTWLEREKITKKVLHNNPGCALFPEKIKTLQEWKDIGWFKPISTEAGSPRIKGKEAIRRELLKPLVTKGTSIMKEEENIKTKIAEEFKKKLKLELLQKKSRNYLSLNPKDNEQNNLNTLRTSKYPIDKNTYDKLVKSTEDNKSPEHTIDNQRKSSDNLKDTTLILPNENNIIPIMQPLTTKYFLDAYKKVTLEDLKVYYIIF